MALRRITSPSDLIPSQVLPVPISFRRSQRHVDFGPEAIDEFRNFREVLIVGQAGAGKTSLTASIAEYERSQGRRTIFVRLSAWGLNEPLEAVLSRVGGSNWNDPLSGAELVVLDAVDESRGGTLDAAFDRIAVMAQTLEPTVRLVVSCRSGGVPSWVLDEFDEIAEVLPLAHEVVESTVRAFLPAYIRAGSAIESDVIEVCRNPMMLSLTTYVGSSTAGRQRLQRVRSNSQLVMLYVDLLLERDVSARRIGSGAVGLGSAGLAKLLLERFAVYLFDSAMTSASDAQLERLCAEWLRDDELRAFFGRDTAAVPSAAELAAAIRTLPLLHVIFNDKLPPEIQFVHLNFRDVLCGSSNMQFQGSNWDEEVLFDTLTKRQIVIRAGLADRAGSISERVIDYGTRVREQDYFQLGAQCVLERWDEEGERVDDLILRVLDAFKNWGKPFDYDLVRTAQSLSGRLSSACPVRLSDDLAYFGNKYAPVQLDAIRTDNPDRLFTYLTSTEEQLRRDALYSIPFYVSSGHLDASASVAKIWQELQTVTESSLLEVAVAAFKKLAEEHPRAVTPLVPGLIKQTGRISAISWRATAFLLNALAYVGGASCVDVIGSYMLNSNNQYRDSASWSLLILSRRFYKVDSSVRSSAMSYYQLAVDGPRNILYDSYALGNVLYSIGDLRLSELAWAVHSSCSRPEAYVREDAVFALGLLEDENAHAPIELLLADADPGVRLKAVEAAGRVRRQSTEDFLRAISASQTELPYIRTVAASSLNLYSTSIDQLQVPIRAILASRRRRDSRTAIIGPVDDRASTVLRSLIEQAIAAGSLARDFRERAINDQYEFIVSHEILEQIERLL